VIAGPEDLVVSPRGARFLGRSMPASLGRGGVVAPGDKREGDGATPLGRWRLLRVYWRADRLARPRTILPALPLGPALGWAEDPADPAYNRPVRLPHRFGVDRMARGDPLYDLCAVTDHNAEPVVPGLGSAIFLHRWRRPRHPTAGCVALSAADLAWTLSRWRPRSRLVVRP
jgi:L,D-peptidoglycan transpeptidase YkuD (ErfK/YbiS/YcfS/YnhG family)